jgi:hypothetical protein
MRILDENLTDLGLEKKKNDNYLADWMLPGRKVLLQIHELEK